MKKQSPKHIVCFALPAWEADYLRSTVELMKGLANDNLVLYVDYAYTISDCIKGILGKKNFAWKRLIGLKPRLRKISGEGSTGLYVLSLPPVFPSFLVSSYRIFKIVNKFNALITGFFINRAIKKLNMKEIVGFNSFQPFLGRYWKIKNLSYLIYYIYDDFTDVPWFKGFVVQEEKEFIDKVDLIIVSSDELKKRKQHYNKPVEVVNNGVHFNAFYNHMKNEAIKEGAIKTVGYIGSIDNRIDIDLLEPVISDLPNLAFVFIGRVFDHTVYDRLIKYKNVKFMPPVPAQKIPALLSEMHVGIIPYVCNKLTAAIYPLKVNEYLAVGIPVVMTPFASIGDTDEVVYKAYSSNSFKQSILLAIEEPGGALKGKRLSLARKADWLERSNQLFELIEQYQDKKAKSLPLQISAAP